MGVFLAIVAFAILIALLAALRWGIPWLWRRRSTGLEKLGGPEKLGLSELQGAARLQSVGPAASLGGKEHHYVVGGVDPADLALPDPDSGQYQQARNEMFARKTEFERAWGKLTRKPEAEAPAYFPAQPLPVDSTAANQMLDNGATGVVVEKVGNDPEEAKPLCPETAAVEEFLRTPDIGEIEVLGRIKSGTVSKDQHPDDLPPVTPQ